MILSKEKKFLFLHVPRTGGTSLRVRLLANVENDGAVFFQHTSLEYFQRKSDVSLSDYFTFAFVRNPWERLASLYSLFKKYDVDGRCGSFEEMLVSSVVKREEVPKLSQIVVNQLELLTDMNGEVGVDFIGRFENYQQDVQVALNRIGLSIDGLEHINGVHFPHYSTLYTSESREIVKEYCRPDIEYFNYSFDIKVTSEDV